jgi:hypothetical protein
MDHPGSHLDPLLHALGVAAHLPFWNASISTVCIARRARPPVFQAV